MTTQAQMAIASHLKALSTSQLQDLFKKSLSQEQIIEILSQKLDIETVSKIPPSMKIAKERIYKQLGMSTTKEVKEWAIAESIVNQSADFRRKETWLKIQSWIDNSPNQSTETEGETATEPASETNELKTAIRTMNVRKLRLTAKTVKLPNWGTIINQQGAEALRSALLQYLG